MRPGRSPDSRSSYWPRLPIRLRSSVGVTVAYMRRSSRLQSRGGGSFPLPSLGPVASPDVGIADLSPAAPPSPAPGALKERPRRHARTPKAGRVRREQRPDGAGVRDDGERSTRVPAHLGIDESPDPGPKVAKAFAAWSPGRPWVPHPSIEAVGIASTARDRGPAVPVPEIEFPQLRAREDMRPWSQDLRRLQAAAKIA